MASRQASIVSVCVEGDRCKQPRYNINRFELLHQITQHLASLNWGRIDAVLFPGGFFCIPALSREQDYSSRGQALDKAGITQQCQQAAKHLDSFAPGAQLVIGIDTLQRWSDENGDQLCVAFSPSGITGLARKIFPTDADTNFAELPPMLVYEDDYSSPHRFITLANGSKVILCACYDAFGFGGAVTGDYGMRQTAIRYIWSEGQERQFVDGGFEALRDSCLDKWESSLATHQPRIALAAIHGFKHLSLSNLWQRHGLSTASAALNGSMAVGSAHIKSGWQDIAHNPGSVAGHSTLAASSVPPAHLHTGIYRQSNFLPARKVSVFKHPKSPHVLMRLFTA